VREVECAELGAADYDEFAEADPAAGDGPEVWPVMSERQIFKARVGDYSPGFPGWPYQFGHAPPVLALELESVRCQNGRYEKNSGDCESCDDCQGPG
jgi:hypothetical protein